MATNIILPFLMSMLLGRTIDLTSYTIGGSVYDDADYEQIPATSMNATYQVLQNDIFPYSFFGLPADIVLRMKSNFLSASSGAMGLDGLLKDTSWKYNSVIVAVAKIHQTVDRRLKKDATPLSDWKERVRSTRTHYADTLFYGGWCVVLFRFKCDIQGDVQAVRNTLTKTLGVIGNVGPDVVDLWKKGIKAIEDNGDIRGQVKVSTHVYSSVELQQDITSPETLLEVLENLPELVGSVGQPLYMNLKPLHELDSQYPVVKEDAKLLEELEKLDEMLDDVKVTKVSLMRWITETLTIFSEDEEERISNLLSAINDCIRAFTKVNADVSLFKNMDHKQVHSAFTTYLKGLEKGMGTYNLAYMKLREEIDAECEDAFLHEIRGLLRVYEDEKIKKGKVEGGLEECKKLCLAEDRCRAVGYADHISQLDRSSGLYIREEKQCWIYFRSTNTADVYTPSGTSGDLKIFDRDCILR